MNAIEAEGGSVVHAPLIEVVPPVDRGAGLRAALASADAATWVAITSANGVDAVVHAFAGQTSHSVATPVAEQASNDRRLEPPWSTAVVGRATAARAAAWTLPVSFESPDPSAAGLGRSLPAAPGDRVIAAVAELAGPELAESLAERNIPVEVVTAYRTLSSELAPEVVEAVTSADVVLVTAPSVIHRLLEVVDGAELPALVAIGATTERAILGAGLPAPTTAADPSVDGLIEAAVRSLRT